MPLDSEDLTFVQLWNFVDTISSSISFCISSAQQAHLFRAFILHTQLTEVAPQLPDALLTSSSGEQSQRSVTASQALQP